MIDRGRIYDSYANLFGGIVNMLFVVDIGNTSITFGIYDGEELISKYYLNTNVRRTADEYGLELLNFLQKIASEIEDIEAIIVSSVVPDIMVSFNKGIQEYLKKEPFIISNNMETGISIMTDNPDELGTDRLVDAVAAFFTYGGPVLIIDFGTATTYDIVTDKGEFLGGVISPGIQICAEALYEMSAKLPKINITKPESIIGKNTVNSLQSGLIYGYIGQVEYIVRNIKKSLHKDLKVIATGGYSDVLKGNTSAIDMYDSDLLFKGLKYLYYKNLKQI